MGIYLCKKTGNNEKWIFSFCLLRTDVEGSLHEMISWIIYKKNNVQHSSSSRMQLGDEYCSQRKERETTEADTEVLMGIYRESPTNADSIKVCSGGGKRKATAEEGAKDKRRKSVPSGRR